MRLEFESLLVNTEPEQRVEVDNVFANSGEPRQCCPRPKFVQSLNHCAGRKGFAGLPYNQ